MYGAECRVNAEGLSGDGCRLKGVEGGYYYSGLVPRFSTSDVYGMVPV